MRFFSTFVEKYGMPWIYGKLPRGAKQPEHDDLLGKLELMLQDAIATGPDDSSIEVHELKGTTSADIYDKYLQRCDNAITKAILLNALSTDIQKTGARAASETGAETIEGDIGQTDRDFPVALFNEIFKRVIDLNIGSGLYPSFEVKEIEDAKTDFATRDKTLSEAAQASGQKIKRTKEYYINNFGYDPDEFEIIDQTEPPAGLPNFLKTGFQPISNNLEPTNGNQSTQLSWWDKFKNLFRRFELQSTIDNHQSIGDTVASALPDKLMQFAMEQTLQPVIELAKNSDSREEFINNLAAQFPKMNSNQIEDLATKVFFIAEIQGRLNAEND